MSLEQDGFVLVERAVDTAVVEHLKAALAEAAMARLERGGETYGGRNLLRVPAVEAANWPVPWHQDLTLALAERRETPGWTNRSVKRGIWTIAASTTGRCASSPDRTRTASFPAMRSPSAATARPS